MRSPWYLGFALLLLLLTPSSFAQIGASPIDINITESGRIVDYFGNYWIVSVTGLITVTNPTALKIFDVSIPFDLNMMSILATDGSQYLYPDRIQIPLINPESSFSIPYTIVGINPTNPTPLNQTVLLNAIDVDNIVSKSILEAQLYKGDIVNGTTSRLVSAHMKNPTAFNYTIAKFEVLKTNTRDPNAILQRWDIKSINNLSMLNPHELITFDIKDTATTNLDIYWLTTDFQLASFNIFDFSDRTSNQFFSEEGLFQDPDVVVERQIEDFIDQTDIDLIVRKVISGKVVNPGDRLNVTIIIDNLGKITKSTNIGDSIPLGFILISSTEGPQINGNELLWENVLVNGQSSKYLKYVLEYTDADSVGVDYFSPVQVKYGNKSAFSPRVPFIRKFMPAQNLYVQKKLRYVGRDVVEVTITLQNLGDDELRNLILQEFLDPLDDFREITQLPQDKGQWEIALLPTGQTWTVTYITNNHERLNTLPEVYGIDRSAVTKSIILVHTIESTLQLTSVQWIEIIGLLSLVLILAGYGALWKYSSVSKKLISLPAKKVEKVEGRLHIIKESVGKNASDPSIPTMSSSADFSKSAPQRESQKLSEEPPPK